MNKSKIVFHSGVYEELNRDNLLFRDANVDIGDDLLLPFLTIAEKARDYAVVVSTSHNVLIEEVNAVVFIDLPKSSDPFYVAAVKSKVPLFLITLESPIIMPEDYLISNHEIYNKVFTWSDELLRAGTDKYVKINYSFDIPVTISMELKRNKKLLTLISGNKNSKYPNELYSARVEAIKYMEKYHPGDFDFYGTDWEYFVFGKSLIERVINKLKIPRKILNKQYKCYKGRIARKKDILKKYAFCICYENVKDVPGYVTEKIFDCFFAGCVPIYLGSDNIDQYVPNNCFVDVRDFDTFEDVYDYLKLMTEEKYQKYIENIQNYLKSVQSDEFSIDNFSKTVLENVIHQVDEVKE